MVEGTEDMCGKFSSYSLKYVSKLVGVCNEKTADEISQIYVKIGAHCGVSF